MMRLLALLLALGFFAPAQADPSGTAIALHGALEQGGLAIGRAAPGSRVFLDGRELRVAADGSFVLGFDRGAPAEAVLVLRRPDGTEAVRRLAVVARDWPVQRIDGLPPKKVTPDPAGLARIRTEGALIAAARERDTDRPWFVGGFAAPAAGPVSGVFGSQRILNGEPRAPHSGTDIAAPAGSPVRAAADGVVSLVHPDMFFTGVTVMIDHGHGLASVYAHLESAVLAAGRAVRRGDTIGRVGASGRATGPHLHWGVSWFGVRLDPETVLRVLPAE